MSKLSGKEAVSASKDGADRVVADIKAKGGSAIAVQGDVAKVSAV